MFLGTLLSVAGYNLWNGATMEAAYKARLQEHLAAHPDDHEAWYALATCTANNDPNRVGATFDRNALEQAIRRDPRPEYLLALVMTPDKDSHDIGRWVEHDPDNAMVWLVSALQHYTNGEIDAWKHDLRRAADCHVMDDPYPESVRIHRRFIRRFFGEGYTADSLVLRQAVNLPMAIATASTSLNQLLDWTSAMILDGERTEARKILKSFYRLGARNSDSLLCWQTADRLWELSLLEGNEDATFWRSIAEGRAPGKHRQSRFDYADPWYSHNIRSHFRRPFISEAWLPLWHLVKNKKLHGVSEEVGEPTCDFWHLGSLLYDFGRRESSHDIITANLDILYSPVRDRETFERLMSLAHSCDAAALTLLDSEWKPDPVPPGDRSITECYVLYRLGVLEILESHRLPLIKNLTDYNFGMWALDGWRAAAEIDRKLFVEEVILGSRYGLDPLHRPGQPAQLLLLRRREAVVQVRRHVQVGTEAVDAPALELACRRACL